MSDKEVISPVNVEARKNLGIRSGDTVRVMQKIVEKGKTRLQAFEGLVLTVKHGTEPGATFTVRKVASGVGVEKTYPLYSPNIDQIEIIKRTKVRRSKLYYIREKASKEIRRAMRNAFMLGTTIESDIAEKERVANEEEEAKKARRGSKRSSCKGGSRSKSSRRGRKGRSTAPAEEPKEEAPTEAEVKEEASTEEKKD